MVQAVRKEPLRTERFECFGSDWTSGFRRIVGEVHNSQEGCNQRVQPQRPSLFQGLHEKTTEPAFLSGAKVNHHVLLGLGNSPRLRNFEALHID